jgi:hypothetical protein
MNFTYKSFFNFKVYENIQLLARMNLIYTHSYDEIPIMANYQGKVEYFYARQMYHADENFDINEYILSLPVVDVQSRDECRNIFEICYNRKIGKLEDYLINKAFIDENKILLNFPTSTTTIQNTTSITSTTSTIVTTTSCPTGVLSRRYYLNATGCAICVPLDEFVCSPYENYYYDNCIETIEMFNYKNINCLPYPSIGPQG